MRLVAVGVLWLAAAGQALALPQGAPIADPATARISAAAQLSTEVAHLETADCTKDSCAYGLSRLGVGASAELALFPGVGLEADFARVSVAADDLDYSEQGTALGGAVELSRRISGDWGAAFTLRGQLTTLPAEASLREVTIGASGTWGRPDAGLVAWLGGQLPLLVDVELPPGESGGAWTELVAGRPLSATFGLALVSDPLGVPWRRTPRATVGLEGWAGQANGASAWLGLAL